MIKIIRFIPLSKVIADAIPYPKSSKHFLPNWFRDADTFGNNKIDRGFQTNATFKKCAPVLDSFTQGYMQELWCDLYVEQVDGNPIITWSSPEQPLSMRNQEQVKGWAVPTGYHNHQFNWHGPWGIKVPKGYSVLYTQPLNRDDLPFRTLDAIVDADTFNLSGMVPFYVKEGFEGIIPAGTPMYQMIPIKRNKWVSKPEKFNETLVNKTLTAVKTHFTGSYKKLYWSKKEFN